MKYSLLIEDKNYTHQIYECAPLTQRITFTTNRVGSPGILKIDLIKAGGLSFSEGDLVRFCVDEMLIFYGYVFAKEKNRYEEITVTCYDQTRYLKAKQSYAFTGMSAGDIIRHIASEFQLKIGTVEDTGYKISTLICENKTCLDTISQALQLTTINTERVFVFFDEGGELTLREAANMKQEIVVGSKSLLTDYIYRTDIDSDTFNRIKLIRPNQETGKADAYIVEDSSAINRWGLLQYYDTVNEEMNPAQIKAQAETMLSYYNRVLRTLKIDALGIPGIRAGQMIYLNIPKLGDMSLSRYVLLERVEHNFENGLHTMNLETRALYGTD